MIKFFRSTRLRLLTENKFTKYLTYGAGEIILVVIGILIALQVNNWNIARQTEFRAEGLSNDLLQELKAVKRLIEDRTSVMERQQKVVQYLISNDEIRMDSINDLTSPGKVQTDPLNFLFSYVVHFNPRGDIYNSAINEGTLALIQSKKTIKQLNTAYTMSEERMSDHLIAENAINALMNEHVANEYQDLFSAGELKNENGAWDNTTTQSILEKIGTDGKLRYLLSAKLQILQFKHGDLKYRVLYTVDQSIKHFEERNQ